MKGAASTGQRVISLPFLLEENETLKTAAYSNFTVKN